MKKLAVVALSFLSSLAMSSMLLANHVYVRANGPSDGNGKSWETAFNSIDAALANLEENPEDTTFWVAAGIYSPITLYTPSGVPGGAVGNNFSTGLLTFNLPDGVKIIGGFKGCEKCLEERCMIPNPLLAVERKCSESDIADKVADYGLTILDGSGSQSWHVITVGDDIARTGANVGLFDLTVRGGYADGPDSGTVDSIFSISSIDYAHDAGGGLYTRFGSVVDIYNVHFVSNGSSGINATLLPKDEPVLAGGGAIGAFDEGTETNISNSYFTYNTAVVFGAGGGAINSSFEAALNVDDSIFSNNTSNRTGGAIRTKDGGDAVINGSYFSENIARDQTHILDQAGGAIEVFQGNLAIEGSTFVHNNGEVGGGAVFFHTFLDDGDPYFLTVNKCVFENNSAGPFGGGAIQIFGQGQHEGSKATISRSIFNKNRGGLGGAIYNNSYETEICHCCFNENLADAWGGAIAADNFGAALLFPPLEFDQRSVTHIDHCNFKNNSTQGVQPVPFGYPPFFTTPQMLNLFAELGPIINGVPTAGTIDQEIVSGGGAVAVLLAGVAKIKHCTFKHNSAYKGAGGAILVGGATGEIINLETEQTFDTFDYATALVKDCKFKHNHPNNAERVDLAGVGHGRDGVTLIIKD
ncbi:MAG: hypothetical protein JSR37_05685 [Verrucomicrobia bacterium]|nr:hypothetical protein [Verrucomicrobiota bacterium]MBS0637048.1 hypothetical protein [Verrucomicrobiota bacterium]